LPVHSEEDWLLKAIPERTISDATTRHPESVVNLSKICSDISHDSTQIQEILFTHFAAKIKA